MQAAALANKTILQGPTLSSLLQGGVRTIPPKPSSGIKGNLLSSYKEYELFIDKI